MIRYFFYGNKDFGKKLIAKLVNLGAINKAFLSGISEDKIFFTEEDGMISCEFIESRKGENIINTYTEIKI